MPKRIVPIKYTSRDFDSIKESLVDYVKRYYPNTFRDFSEASFGSLMLDTVSYVGDVLSFYLDYQANESFLNTAVEYNNIIRLGKQFGYKFKANPSSHGIATFYIVIPKDNTGSPDIKYIPTIKKNTQIKSKNGGSFMLDEDVNFDHPNNEIRVARVDGAGLPEDYAIKAFGRVVSGITHTETITVGEYKRYLRLPLGAYDVANIISVFDTEGHEYHEVEYLSQDVIYRAATNRKSSNIKSPAILKPYMVPRRFVVERERNTTYLQFGAGSDIEYDVDNVINPMVTDPANVVLKLHGSPHISDTSFDPYKLVSSDKLGIAPSSTSLTITMRVNTMDSVNASVDSLNIIQEAIVDFKDKTTLTSSTVLDVVNSIEVTNDEPIIGDISLPDSIELKRRILDSFATQNRAVTAKDYEALAYSMPAQFGAIKRCKVARDAGSRKRNLNMYIISENENEQLESSNDILKENLKTWLGQGKMISDTIDILDAKIINLAIDYEAVGRSNVSKFEVLEEANNKLKKHFTRLPEIGESFWITDIYSILKEVEAVVDVTNVNITLQVGGLYSNINIDILQNTSADGRYIEIPKNCIVEIKYKNQDINGVIK